MVTVLWFVAAMALLVAGISGSARTDVRMAQFHLQEAQGTAAADGAIKLFLADLVDGRFAADRPVLAWDRYRLGEMEVVVVAVPTAELVNVNGAPPQQLRGALEAAGLGDRSGALTRAIVAMREAPRNQVAARLRSDGAFPVLEALLQVPGLGRAEWDALRDYVTANSFGAAGAGRSERDSARSLNVLRGLTPAQRASRPSLAPGAVNVGGGEGAQWNNGGRLRVDAMFRHGGHTWLRRQWVRVGLAGSTALPWSTERIETTRVVNP
jgi:type II secretory pathway component PulK